MNPWSKYRRQRRLFYCVWFGGFVASILLVFAVQALAPRTLGFVFPATGVLWITATVVMGFKFSRFPCPRCEKPFITGTWYTNSWTTRCVHCGLPKWSEPDPKRCSP